MGCTGLKEIKIPNSVTTISNGAFQGCTGLLTVSIPSLVDSIEEETMPWKKFEKIMIIEGTEIKKCATPDIAYTDGKLVISCETEGAECYYTLKSADFKPSNTIVENNSVNLSACYDITCYAVSDDCIKSDIATAKLYWLPSSGSLDETSINNVSMRGIAIQSAGGIVTTSGLNNDETVSFYATDGKNLGFSTAINGTTFFSAKSGSVVIAKFGNESIKILVK